jgi:hypothetical protein
LNSSLGGIRFKTSRRKDLCGENLSQSCGPNGPLTLGDEDVPFAARFNDVQVRESNFALGSEIASGTLRQTVDRGGAAPLAERKMR